MDFYRCAHCGNIVTILTRGGVPLYCCEEEMKLLVPGVVEASAEKHIPVIETEGNRVTVKIGSVEHPMEPEHHIEWIVLETSAGCQIAYLKPGEKPHAEFILNETDKVIAAYEYCNLHSLWKK